MSAFPFLRLPHDILYLICLQLTPRDLLALIQTCRVLHALGITDYIWHHIYHDLPLDLSDSPDGRLRSLPATALRGAAVNALKLDTNWRKKTSHISRVTKICSQHTIIGIQPLGPHWFVTLGRAPNSGPQLSVSRLDHTPDRYAGFVKSTRLANFHSPNTFAFASCLQRGGEKALVCTLGWTAGGHKNGLLHVYSVDLRADEDLPHISPDCRLLSEWRIEKPGVLYFAQIFEHIVATVQLPSIAGPGYAHHQIVFFNAVSGNTITVQTDDLKDFERGKLQFKLYGEHIVLVGVTTDQELKALVREVPREVFSPWPAEETLLTSWASNISDFRTEAIPLLEFYIPLEPNFDPSADSFPVLVLSQPNFHQKGQVHVFRFPFTQGPAASTCATRSTRRWRPCSTFPIPRGVTMEAFCFGKTGHRAVWLEHLWNNSDEYRLMKASLSYRSEFEPLVQPIQAVSLVLPFQLHTCRVLSFEEANGRLWVGVHTGDIYVLDFLSVT